MNVAAIVTMLLLAIVVAVQLTCALGMLVARGALSRLHFVTPASTLAMAALALAVLIGGQSTATRIKAVLLAVIVSLIGAVVTHATGRAAVIRRDRGLARTRRGGA